MSVQKSIARVTDKIRARSEPTRSAYLERLASAAADGPARAHLSCGNQAHAYAAMGPDKPALVETRKPNIGIVTTYNDMLSAHQPYEHYPELIRQTARAAGPRRRLQAAFRRCATASRKARREWSFRSFRAM